MPAADVHGTRLAREYCPPTTTGASAQQDDTEPLRSREAWERLFHRFDVLVPDQEVAWRYGRLYRELQERGSPIGANDLWIAATALVHELPLVTRNLDGFGRVPDLEVVRY